MYKVPLTPAPNQSFQVSIPVNRENRNFKFDLWYNYQAEYWLLAVSDLTSNKMLFDNIPLLVSYGKFFNMLCQLGYLQIGICGVLPNVSDFSKSMPNDENIGSSYVLVWGDNSE